VSCLATVDMALFWSVPYSSSFIALSQSVRPIQTAARTRELEFMWHHYIVKDIDHDHDNGMRSMLRKSVKSSINLGH